MSDITVGIDDKKRGPFQAVLGLRRAWLAIDSNAQAISLVKTRMGAIALLAVFMLAMAATIRVSTPSLVLVTIALFAIICLPAARLNIITGASLFFVLVRPYRIDGWQDLQFSLFQTQPAFMHPMALQISAVTGFLALAAGFLWFQRNHKDNIISKRPVMALILGWFALFTIALALPNDTIIRTYFWTLIGVTISCLWFLAYAALDQKGKDKTPAYARGLLMRPFWGGSATPIGKSYGYLNKFDAKTDDDLAVTRLKALKLMVWALLLTGALQVSNWALYQHFQLPTLQVAIMAFVDGNAAPISTNWATVLSNYFLDLLIISIWGHIIVATIRMVGFRIPRNTYNPMASRSLAEFWNRYFFYFKELLVDFFFYPAFLRYFKTNTKLRIAFATLCAAGLGNFLYHFMRETYIFEARPFGEALMVFQSAVFYSLILATGLIISQWRGKKPKAEDGFLAYHIMPRINVIAFFCFLKIFDDLTGEGTLMDRFAFMGSLFGIA